MREKNKKLNLTYDNLKSLTMVLRKRILSVSSHPTNTYYPIEVLRITIESVCQCNSRRHKRTFILNISFHRVL